MRLASRWHLGSPKPHLLSCSTPWMLERIQHQLGTWAKESHSLKGETFIEITSDLPPVLIICRINFSSFLPRCGPPSGAVGAILGRAPHHEMQFQRLGLCVTLGCSEGSLLSRICHVACFPCPARQLDLRLHRLVETRGAHELPKAPHASPRT